MEWTALKWAQKPCKIHTCARLWYRLVIIRNKEYETGTWKYCFPHSLPLWKAILESQTVAKYHRDLDHLNRSEIRKRTWLNKIRQIFVHLQDWTWLLEYKTLAFELQRNFIERKSSERMENFCPPFKALQTNHACCSWCWVSWVNLLYLLWRLRRLQLHRQRICKQIRFWCSYGGKWSQRRVRHNQTLYCYTVLKRS